MKFLFLIPLFCVKASSISRDVINFKYQPEKMAISENDWIKLKSRNRRSYADFEENMGDFLLHFSTLYESDFLLGNEPSTHSCTSLF